MRKSLIVEFKRSSRFMNTLLQLIEKQTHRGLIIFFLGVISTIHDRLSTITSTLRKHRWPCSPLPHRGLVRGCLRGPISLFRGLPRVFNGHDRFLGLSPRLPANRSPCPIGPNEFQCCSRPTVDPDATLETV